MEEQSRQFSLQQQEFRECQLYTERSLPMLIHWSVIDGLS